LIQSLLIPNSDIQSSSPCSFLILCTCFALMNSKMR
jgi:hypothetical protein